MLNCFYLPKEVGERKNFPQPVRERRYTAGSLTNLALAGN